MFVEVPSIVNSNLFFPGNVTRCFDNSLVAMEHKYSIGTTVVVEKRHGWVYTCNVNGVSKFPIPLQSAQYNSIQKCAEFLRWICTDVQGELSGKDVELNEADCT